MGNIKRLPAKPLFDETQLATVESLETKKIWSCRLLYLLNTPLANVDLSKVKELSELNEMYNMKGMTVGDLIHLQQIIKAAEGDTRAYKAINDVAMAAKTQEQDDSLKEPLVKMVDILYSSIQKARNEEKVNSDKANAASNIIEVDLTDYKDGE